MNNFNELELSILDHFQLYGLGKESAEDLLHSIQERHCPGLKFVPRTKDGRARPLEEAKVRQICGYLQAKPLLSCMTVARLCKTKVHHVFAIYSGRAFADISKDYSFAEKRKLLEKYRKTKP